MYFNKFGTLATGEDDSIKETIESYFKEIVEELEKHKTKVINSDTKEEVEVVDNESFSKAFQKFTKRPKISPIN